MNVLELFASIILDTSDYEKSLDDAGKETSNFGDKLKNGLATAAKVGAAAIGALTTAATDVTGAVIKGAGEVAAYGDNIDKMSQKMGLSAEAYQEWDAIMQHSGTSMESLKSGMKTLANAVENGNDAFERLGISQEQIASMNQEELFSATISALQNVESETERTYLAGQLLGKGATELGALLNTSAEDTEAMRQRVHELGGVMSDEAVKASAAYQDSLQDMKTAMSGVSRGIMSDFMPSITTLMNGFTELIIGGDSANELISEGINGMVQNITDKLPQIMSAAEGIIDGLLTAIIDNLPSLIESGTQILISIVEGIVGHLPSLVSAAVDIMVTLATGLIDAIPTLILAIPDIIMAFANGVIDNLPKIIESGQKLMDSFKDGIFNKLPDMLAQLPEIIDGFLGFITENLPNVLNQGMELLNSLIDGILGAIPDLLAALPSIITSFINFIADNLPSIVSAGIDLLMNLITGIIKAIPDLIAALPQIIVAIVKGIGSLLGSIVKIGKNIVEGIWEGIVGMATWIKEKVTGFFDGIVGGIKDFLGIHSPSTVFADMGKNMALGLGEGWDDEFSDVQKQIQDGMDFGTATVDFASSGLGMSSAGIVNGINSAASSGGSNITIPINLMLPDMTVLASYLLGPLVNYANANGTPILNPM